MVIKGMTLWHWEKIADNILEYAKHDKDCVVGISGEEGDGKSVISRIFAKRQYPELLGKELDLNECMFFGKKELKASMEESEKHLFIQDEAIDNFNRTFYEKDQVEFVKMLKVIRDHNHILYENIPVLWELDSGIRRRVRVYLYIVSPVNIRTKEGGIVYVFKKQRGAFTPDPWHVKLNQRLDMQGMIHKSPNFFGYFIMPYLGDEDWFVKMESEARIIKDRKRMQVIDGEEGDYLHKPTMSVTINKLRKLGLVKKGDLAVVAHEMGYSYERFTRILASVEYSNVRIRKPSKEVVTVSSIEQIDDELIEEIKKIEQTGD